MRLKRTLLVWSLLILAGGYGIALAEDFDLGRIIEVSLDKSFIQVNDRTYKVGPIQVLYLPDKPRHGSAANLTEGALVKVVKGAREDSYYHAELIVVFKGQMAKRLSEAMELPAYEDTESNNSGSKSVSDPNQNQLIYEDGVWRN